MAPSGPSSFLPPQDAAARRFSLLLVLSQVLCNVFGAGLVTIYFLFLDRPDTSSNPSLMTSIVLTAALVVLGSTVATVWSRPLREIGPALSQGRAVSRADLTRAQRRALSGPLFYWLNTLVMWVLAALTMGLYSLVYPESGQTPAGSLLMAARVCFGVLASGLATASFVFFLSDALFRRMRPLYFPAGDLTALKGVPRLGVRFKLLYAFMIVSVLPPVAVGLMIYTRLAFANPPGGAQDLPFVLLFVGACLVALALVLSRLVAGHLAGPLEEMKAAMARVEGGDLAVRVPVRDSDELGALGESFNRMIEGLRERDRISETFGRLVSRQIAEAVLREPPPPEGEGAVVSVLFCDIRDYTTICERMDPPQVIAFLNAFFSRMVAAVEQNQGLVYQFLGDGLMAVFGAPVKQQDHATHALEAALAMFEQLAALNRERAGLPALDIGVGIASGSVVAGLVGAAERQEYGVVGDIVNLASRIEGLNKKLGTHILLSRTTRDLLTERYALADKGPQGIRGRQETVQVFALMLPAD